MLLIFISLLGEGMVNGTFDNRAVHPPHTPRDGSAPVRELT